MSSKAEGGYLVDAMYVPVLSAPVVVPDHVRDLLVGAGWRPPLRWQFAPAEAARAVAADVDEGRS